MLIEFFLSLHTTAHRFIFFIEIYNENRDIFLLDQLAATNNFFLAAFVAFNELVFLNTSPRAITAIFLVVSLTPLLPVFFYFSYKALRRLFLINPTIDQQMFFLSMLHKAYASFFLDARENILFMFFFAY
ncbi:hypothetical protein TRFO_22786 [Tritrichomonas foetus]|uniref:Uncharacterized protein n=1 Tax=Tritrichomonas foetus TaxID=1144522 RepID=A0A1J4KFP2_9EUKA|nr:hypothetical protein TRFO_22786 [Tritrichomonas foetus]|eukprot:OHT08604.1 hypothetical protein TRFO_22786 [Tritrichomonas foetus]